MEAQWFFIRDGAQQGPISLDQMQEKLRSRALAPVDLVWSTSLSGWTPASQVPELAEAAGGETAGHPTPHAMHAPGEAVLGYRTAETTPIIASARALELLRQTRPWARFIAILLFIGAGFLLLFGCIGGVSTMAAGRGVGVLSGIMLLINIPIAMLYIAPAIFLNRYASRITDVLQSHRSEHLEAALESQKSFWKFVGIAFLVVIGLYLLIMLVGMFAVIGFGRF